MTEGGRARPAIAPDVLADLLEAAPARVRTRLERDGAAADGWAWEPDGSGWTVASGDETVRLQPRGEAIIGADEVTCTCLLAPRCFHLLAVVNRLAIAGTDPDEQLEDRTDQVDDDIDDDTGAAAGAPDDAAKVPATSGIAERSAGSAPDPRDEPEVEVTEQQRAAADRTWRAACAVLAGGAGAAGPLAQAQVLRAAHECQSRSLHRLAAAATRVATGVRDLGVGDPSFELTAYAGALAERLAVARRLGSGTDARPRATRADLGTGRRAYAPIGTRHLHGLASEPVVTASGYAGVVTYLVDDAGETWSVSDVAPGEPGRALAAYRSAVRFGTLAIQHDELGRSQVYGQGLTASLDGRLGSGRSVRSSRGGDSSWDDDAIAARWREPFEVQLDRAFAVLDTPPGLRGPGASLLFLDAIVLGQVGGGLDLLVINGAGSARVRGVRVPSGTTVVTADLRLLATMTGAPLRFVARLVPNQPRTVTLLAVAPASVRTDHGPDDDTGIDGAPPSSLVLPARWRGRANLGLDRLGPSFVVRAGGLGSSGPTAELPGPDDDLEAPPEPDPATAAEPDHWSSGDDPLDPLVRLLERAALGGRMTLGPGAHPVIDRARASLDRDHLQTGARLLTHLEATAHETLRSITGETYAPPPDALARAWCGAMTYARSVRSFRARSSWA